jgi:hypothetical protein
MGYPLVSMGYPLVSMGYPLVSMGQPPEPHKQRPYSRPFTQPVLSSPVLCPPGSKYYQGACRLFTQPKLSGVGSPDGLGAYMLPPYAYRARYGWPAMYGFGSTDGLVGMG